MQTDSQMLIFIMNDLTIKIRIKLLYEYCIFEYDNPNSLSDVTTLMPTGHKSQGKNQHRHSIN